MPLSHAPPYPSNDQDAEISVVVVTKGSPDFSIKIIPCPASQRAMDLHRIVDDGLRHEGITIHPATTLFLRRGDHISNLSLVTRVFLSRQAFTDFPEADRYRPIELNTSYNDALRFNSGERVQLVVLQEGSVFCVVVRREVSVPKFCDLAPPSSQDATLRSHLVDHGVVIPENASMYLHRGRLEVDQPERFRYPSAGGTHVLLDSSCTYRQLRIQPGQQAQMKVVIVPNDRARCPLTKENKSDEHPRILIIGGSEALLPSFLDRVDVKAVSKTLDHLENAGKRTILLDPTAIIAENCTSKSGPSNVMSLVTGESGSGKTLFIVFALLLLDIKLKTKAERIWSAGVGVLRDTEIARRMSAGDVTISPNTYLCLSISFREDEFRERPGPDFLERYRKHISGQLDDFCHQYMKQVPSLGRLRSAQPGPVKEKPLNKRLDEILDQCLEENRAVVFLGDDIDSPHQVYMREILRHEPEMNSGNGTSMKEIFRDSWIELVSLCRSIERGLARGAVAHAFVTATWPITIAPSNTTANVTWCRHRVNGTPTGSGIFSREHLERILRDPSLSHALTVMNQAHPQWRDSLSAISSGGSYNPRFLAGFFRLLFDVSRSAKGQYSAKGKHNLPPIERIRISFENWKMVCTRTQLHLYSQLMEMLTTIRGDEGDEGWNPHKPTKLVLDEEDTQHILAPRPSLLSSDLTAAGGLSRRTVLILLQSEGVLFMDRSAGTLDGSGAVESFLRFSDLNLEASISKLRVARAPFMNRDEEIDLSSLPSELEKHIQHSFNVDKEWLYNEYAFQDYVLMLLRSNKTAKDKSFYVAKEIELRVSFNAKIKWGFLDLGIIPVPVFFKGVIHILELKLIRLEYLFKGKYGKYPGTEEELFRFGKLVMEAREEDILDMLLRYKDRETKEEVEMKVREVVEKAQDQVAGYVIGMANGCREAYDERKLAPQDPVCTDYRITNLKPESGYTMVKGYVLVNVGNVRVLGQAGEEYRQMQGVWEYKVESNLPPVASSDALREKRKKQSEYKSQFVPVRPYYVSKENVNSGNPKRRGQ